MTESKTSKGNSSRHRFGHWVRVVVMFLSFGFIFPHAMTEDVDTTRQTTDQKGE